MITTPYDKMYYEMKTIGSIELESGNNLQKPEIILSDGSLKSLRVFGQYVNIISEACTTKAAPKNEVFY